MGIGGLFPYLPLQKGNQKEGQAEEPQELPNLFQQLEEFKPEIIPTEAFQNRKQDPLSSLPFISDNSQKTKSILQSQQQQDFNFDVVFVVILDVMDAARQFESSKTTTK